jgi:hypothetical protein
MMCASENESRRHMRGGAGLLERRCTSDRPVCIFLYGPKRKLAASYQATAGDSETSTAIRRRPQAIPRREFEDEREDVPGANGGRLLSQSRNRTPAICAEAEHVIGLRAQNLEKGTRCRAGAGALCASYADTHPSRRATGSHRPGKSGIGSSAYRLREDSARARAFEGFSRLDTRDPDPRNSKRRFVLFVYGRRSSCRACVVMLQV